MKGRPSLGFLHFSPSKADCVGSAVLSALTCPSDSEAYIVLLARILASFHPLRNKIVGWAFGGVSSSQLNKCTQCINGLRRIGDLRHVVNVCRIKGIQHIVSNGSGRLVMRKIRGKDI